MKELINTGHSLEECDEALPEICLEHKVCDWSSHIKCTLKEIKKNIGNEEYNYYIFFTQMEKCLEIERLDWFYCAANVVEFIDKEIGCRDENFTILKCSIQYCLDNIGHCEEEFNKIGDVISGEDNPDILAWMEDNYFYSRVESDSDDSLYQKEECYDSSEDEESEEEECEGYQSFDDEIRKPEAELVKQFKECRRCRNKDRDDFCDKCGDWYDRWDYSSNQYTMYNERMAERTGNYDFWNNQITDLGRDSCDDKEYKAVKKNKVIPKEIVEFKMEDIYPLKIDKTKLSRSYPRGLLTEEEKVIVDEYRREEKRANDNDRERQKREDIIKCKEDLSLLNTNHTIDDLRSDKDNHNTMFKKISGRYYTFSTDKVYPLLNNEIIKSIVPNTPTIKNIVNSVYHDSKAISRGVLKQYDVATKYSKYFRVKDGKITFIIIVRVDGVENIGEQLLNNRDVIIPSLFNCYYCGKHTDDEGHYVTHRKTRKCRQNRGLTVEEKVIKTYQCKECNSSVWTDRGQYNRHRRTNTCKEARGIIVVEKSKVDQEDDLETFQCKLCNTSVWTDKGQYNRHRKTKKCRRRQKENPE